MTKCVWQNIDEIDEIVTFLSKNFFITRSLILINLFNLKYVNSNGNFYVCSVLNPLLGFIVHYLKCRFVFISNLIILVLNVYFLFRISIVISNSESSGTFVNGSWTGLLKMFSEKVCPAIYINLY